VVGSRKRWFATRRGMRRWLAKEVGEQRVTAETEAGRRSGCQLLRREILHQNWEYARSQMASVEAQGVCVDWEKVKRTVGRGTRGADQRE
jgi:hypothetical protein